MDTEKMGSAAKAAERILGVADTNTKNNALEAMASALESDADKIISANETDLANGRKNGMMESLLDRLRLTRERIAGMADGIRQVAALSDPIGEIIEGSGFNQLRVGLIVGVVVVDRGDETADLRFVVVPGVEYRHIERHRKDGTSRHRRGNALETLAPLSLGNEKRCFAHLRHDSIGHVDVVRIVHGAYCLQRFVVSNM